MRKYGGKIHQPEKTKLKKVIEYGTVRKTGKGGRRGHIKRGDAWITVAAAP